MWIDALGEVQQEMVFGKYYRDIVTYYKQNYTNGKNQSTYETHTEETPHIQCHQFGPNGTAVELFIESWKDIRWGHAEGMPISDATSCIQVPNWKAALEPTNRGASWMQALELAGIRQRGMDNDVSRAWLAAEAIGERIGGHQARLLAGATAGELVQCAKGCHFFLMMMPWIRMGHWPCGWDEDKKRPIIF